MKELTIQQKAKAYDKAFKIAQELYNNPNSSKVGKGYVCTVFPELAESKYERIRKEILEYFQQFDNKELRGVDISDWIAWLEKQGEKDILENTILDSNEDGLVAETIKYKAEQKPADKVELRFKVDDWVVFNNKHQSIYQVEKIEDGYYILRHTHGGTFRVCVLHDESLRLWTIQDAKDGDVLAEDSCIFIIQKLGDNNTTAKTYYTLYFDGDFDDGSMLYFDIDSTKPATKEQRDTLFTKMKEAGYEWDAEKKKKLKKISQRMISVDAKEALYDKPTWSEEDMSKVQRICKYLDEAKKYYADITEVRECMDWLKSLKDRF